MEVLTHVRDIVIKAPEHDPRNIVDLVERYRDAHTSDCRWREADREEWYLDTRNMELFGFECNSFMKYKKNRGPSISTAHT